MSNKKLFDDDSGDEEKVDKILPINKNYAEKYGNWRKKEDYERLKAKYGVKDFDSEDSNSEESDDENYIEPDNPEFDMDFFRVLAAIRTKHPILKEKNKFFKDSYQSKVKEEENEEKPLYVSDYERKRLLEKNYNNYNDDENFAKPGSSRLVKENKNLLNAKQKFKFDDNLSDDDGEDLFKKKESQGTVYEPKETTNETEDKNEAVQFLKGKKKELSDKLDEDLLGALKKDWDTNMSKEDKFLMDYFVNKRYLEEEDETKQRPSNHFILDFEPLENDEDTYNKMEEFETKYRFRFEEPDQEFIRGHPRVVEETVRQKENKRKEERDKKKNRLREEEEKRKQEIMRLKAFKKQEILERIDMLKEAAGIENDLDPKNFNLEADFDPEQHDALMSQFFDDNYYNTEVEQQKPTFEDEELQRELEEEYEKLKELDNMAEGTYKYVDVASNSYGLTTEEILFAKDAELNRWYSINRILKYGQGNDEEKGIRKNFEKRGANLVVKKKILPSLFSDNIEEQWETEEERRRRRNLKKKERKQKKKLKMEEEEEATTVVKSVEMQEDSEEKYDALAENLNKDDTLENESLEDSSSVGDTMEAEQSCSESHHESVYDENIESDFEENSDQILKLKKKLDKSDTNEDHSLINNKIKIDNYNQEFNNESVSEQNNFPPNSQEIFKKKRKRKKSKNKNLDSTIETENSLLECNDPTVNSKNNSIEISSNFSQISLHNSEENVKKNRKRKKAKKKDLDSTVETENSLLECNDQTVNGESFSADISSNFSQTSEENLKKKRKRKKKKNKNLGSTIESETSFLECKDQTKNDESNSAEISKNVSKTKIESNKTNLDVNDTKPKNKKRKRSNSAEISKNVSKTKIENNKTNLDVNDTKPKNKKRKRNDDDGKKSNKKKKFSSKKLQMRNQLKGISAARVLAYGQNPNKIKSLKYSNKFK